MIETKPLRREAIIPTMIARNFLLPAGLEGGVVVGGVEVMFVKELGPLP